MRFDGVFTGEVSAGVPSWMAPGFPVAIAAADEPCAAAVSGIELPVRNATENSTFFCKA